MKKVRLASYMDDGFLERLRRIFANDYVAKSFVSETN